MASVLLKPPLSQEGRGPSRKPLPYLWDLHGAFPGNLLPRSRGAFCELFVAPPVRHLSALSDVSLVLHLVLDRLHQQQARPGRERECWEPERSRLSDTVPRVPRRGMARRHSRRNCTVRAIGEGHGSLGMTPKARIYYPKLEPLPFQHHQKLLDSLPRHYCPNPRCSALVQLDEDSENPQAVCPSCQSVICVPCRVVWHESMYRTGRQWRHI